MLILFTTSKYPTSWLIRKLTREDCSHCAIQVGLEVIHSNFRGCNLATLQDFTSNNQILHMVYVPTPEGLTAQALYNDYKGVGYDFGALLYAGLRILCRFLPKVNLWQTTGMYLCSELVTRILDGEEDSMITPHNLYLKLRERSDNESY